MISKPKKDKPSVFIFGNYSKENKKKMDGLVHILEEQNIDKLICLSESQSSRRSIPSTWRRGPNFQIYDASKFAKKYKSPLIADNSLIKEEFQRKKDRTSSRVRAGITFVGKKKPKTRTKNVLHRRRTEKVKLTQPAINIEDSLGDFADFKQRRVKTEVTEQDRFCTDMRLSQMQRTLSPKFMKQRFKGAR